MGRLACEEEDAGGKGAGEHGDEVVEERRKCGTTEPAEEEIVEDGKDEGLEDK